MALKAQKHYSRQDLLHMVASVLYGRVTRRKMVVDTNLNDWEVEGYMDGPVVFVVLTHPSGAKFTGWSKFDYEGRFNEQNGIYRALQKAVDKYAEELAYQKTWGVSSLDEDEGITKVIKESVEHETASNQSSGIDS